MVRIYATKVEIILSITITAKKLGAHLTTAQRKARRRLDPRRWGAGLAPRRGAAADGQCA